MLSVLLPGPGIVPGLVSCPVSDNPGTARHAAAYGAVVSLARDVIARLRAALARTAAARETIGRVRGQADEMLGEIQAATDETSDERPGEAMVRLQQAQIRLDEALAEFDAGDAAVEAYIDELGDEGGPADTSPAPVQQRPALGPPPRPDMEVAATIRQHVGKPKTVGQVTVGGQAVGGEIWSGRDGPGRGGPGLAEPWRRMETMTMHVEGHAAAVMRRDGHRDAVVYVSRPPCDYLPDGCDARLRDVIPAGSRLTVYVVGRGGGVTRRIFEGNGKGIQR